MLDGSKIVVSHGEAADKLIVSARTSGERYDEDGITLFLVDAAAQGVARRGYATRDETRAADISLSNAAGEVLGEVGKGLAVIEKIVEAGIAATAAETVGAMEAMNEMTLEYSKTRVQFGQPIGSYQVVQHRLSDMFMAQEQGRSMAMLATMSVDNTDDVERRHDFALAKVGVGQSGRYVSQSAVQMHGGIGMTEEYAVGHYFRRCMVIERLFGDPAYYLQRLANEVAWQGRGFTPSPRPRGAAPWIPAKGGGPWNHSFWWWDERGPTVAFRCRGWPPLIPPPMDRF